MKDCCKEGKEHEKSDTMELSINTNSLVAIFLAIVFVASAFQTWQLTQFSDKISGQQAQIAGLKTTGFTATAGSFAGPVQQGAPQATVIPSSLQNLPEMVGGC